MKLSPANAGLIGQVVEGTSDAVLIIDEDQRIIYANEGATVVFGYLPDDLTGRLLTILIPERHIPRHADRVRSFQTGAELLVSRPGWVSSREELVGLRHEQR